VKNVGVVVYNPALDALHWRFLDDWTSVTADPQDQEYLALLSMDLVSMAAEMGPGVFLNYLESTLSGVLRITDRTAISVNDPDSVVDDLFLEQVASSSHSIEASRALKAGSGNLN